MYAVPHRGGQIVPQVTVVKALVSALCIGGGSTGREEPIVQIGSAAGSTIAQLLRLDTSRVRLLATDGSARTGRLLSKQTIYTAKLLRCGVRLEAPTAPMSVTAANVAQPPPESLPTQTPLTTAAAVLSANSLAPPPSAWTIHPERSCPRSALRGYGGTGLPILDAESAAVISWVTYRRCWQGCTPAEAAHSMRLALSRWTAGSDIVNESCTRSDRRREEDIDVTMIDAVVCVAMLAYCVYACHVQSPNRSTADDAAARTSDTGWTELDERQLIRLLRDSAP